MYGMTNQDQGSNFSAMWKMSLEMRQFPDE